MLEAKCFIIKNCITSNRPPEGGNWKYVENLDSQDHIVCLAVY